MQIEIIEKGKRIGMLSCAQFMAMARDNLGIGRSRFLAEYIERYNELLASEETSAQISLEQSNG